MSTTSVAGGKKSAGGFNAFVAFGLLLAVLGLAMTVTIKASDGACDSVRDHVPGLDTSKTPMSDELGACLAQQMSTDAAKTASQSTAAMGLIVLGSAFMVSGAGFAIARSRNGVL